MSNIVFKHALLFFVYVNANIVLVPCELTNVLKCKVNAEFKMN